MADAAADPEAGGGSNTENIQNETNENCENELVEQTEAEGGSEMEVDGHAADGTTEVGVVENNENVTANGDGGGEKTETATTDDKTVAVAVAEGGEDKPVDQIKTEPQVEETEKVEQAPPAPSTVVEQEATDSVQTKLPTDTEIVQVETLVKTEDGDGDSYMVLEEADGDDNESILSEDEEELSENEQLRRANRELSERVTLLEEFIEVEFSEKFDRFIKKRAHLVEVMGLSGNNEGQKCNGKRSSKSQELVGLLKIVNDQAKNNRSPRKTFKNSSQDNQSLSPNKNASSSTNKPKETSNITNAKNEGTSSDAKPRRCHRCNAVGHMVRECPLPIEPRDRRVILKKERRKEYKREKKEKDRLEGIQNPKLKAMRDRRRRLGRAITRERMNPRMK